MGKQLVMSSGILDINQNPVPIKYAAVSGNTSGDNTLVALVANKKIRLISLIVVAAAAVDFRLESNAGGTALSGVMSLAANAGFSIDFNSGGICETVAGQLLNMELSAAVQVSGMLSYIEV